MTETGFHGDRKSMSPTPKQAENLNAQENTNFSHSSVEDKFTAKSAGFHDRGGKALPTMQGKAPSKRELIIKYRLNNPRMTAFDIANKAHTTPSYVYKVLSEAQRLSKEIRGRRGRIFAHGKIFYEFWVSRGWLAALDAPVVNPRTGMMQVGFADRDDPCSCQIHRNGHLVIWPRRSGWRDWLAEELSLRGWSQENARVVVDHAQLNVSVVEGGVKPGDPGFLPKDLYLETEWGVVICKDDSPEKSVLELKLSIPKMQSYLGIPDLMKRLEAIESTLESLFYTCRAVGERTSFSIH